MADGVHQIVHVLAGGKTDSSERLVDVLGACNICHGLFESTLHVFEEFTVGIHDFGLDMRDRVDVGELPVSVYQERKHLLILSHDVVGSLD